MTKEQQVEKLEEGLARELHYRDWDHEISMAYNYGTSGTWDEQDNCLKNFYLSEAAALLSIILADLKIDTGELTPEDIEKGLCLYCSNKTIQGHNRFPCKQTYCPRVADFRAGVKAARAKFVSIGEIVK